LLTSLADRAPTFVAVMQSRLVRAEVTRQQQSAIAPFRAFSKQMESSADSENATSQ
jgi:hypothetical protein